jgi:hypothetical protein
MEHGAYVEAKLGYTPAGAHHPYEVIRAATRMRLEQDDVNGTMPERVVLGP